MRTLLLASLGIITLLVAVSPSPTQFDHVARTPPRAPEDERALFTVPPGFEVQLVAAEPQINKPMNLAFDARGRLWVTDTVEYPFPAEGRPGRDSVKVLEDFDENGRARKVTTFAAGLNIPIGVMPVNDGALVFSIPHVTRLTDSDGDSRADRRDVLFGPFGLKDTHGLVNGFTWGFDGWLYACHGFANTSTVKGADGHALTMQSGNVFRMRPDGGRVEQYTWGQVNPFGLAFDPLGNLFSADCHSRPLMMLLRGAYYQSFGKPHDGLGFAPEICGHSHGSTAIAGIAYYAADYFPPAYRDTLFLGNVVTNRINHDRLERHGSTLRAVEQPDFLVSRDPWFRPVDIKLGPDGALYVADFYNRIIGHYEVPLTHPGRDRERGRIWRIVYRGPDGTGKPTLPRRDWTRARVAELIEDLAHPNLVVRTTAANQLVARGASAAEAVRGILADPKSAATQRAHALWVLERLAALDEATLLAGAVDAAVLVRVHAVRILAERRELLPVFRNVLRVALQDADAFVRRAAADALGCHPSGASLRALLDLRHTVPPDDTQLLHTVRMALREHLRSRLNARSVADSSWKEADGRALADVAPGVPGPEAARFLMRFLERYADSPPNVQRFVQHIARWGTDAELARLIAFAQKQRSDDVGHEATLLRAVHQGTQARGATPFPALDSWARDVVTRCLSSTDGRLVQNGAELAGTFRLEATQPKLADITVDRRRGVPERTAALAALATLDPKRYIGLAGRLVGDADDVTAVRERAAQVLATIGLPEARAELARHLSAVPARLQGALAIALASHRDGAELLLETVSAGKASARVLQEPAVLARLNAAKLPRLAERLAKLTANLPPAEQRLLDLFQRRQAGFRAAKANATAGIKVFEKHCAACHQLNGKGAKVGPQLDGIGARGLDRLLEDLLDPNRNVDQAFRTTTLALVSGQVVAGLLLREEGQVIILADNQGKEVRVPKQSVQERQTTPLSPMPGNLVDQVPEAEFYDLLAYLLSQRAGPGGSPSGR